ncbi:N-acetylglucosamine-6-phosphate deacetylase [Janibacter sp. CX7]|uniref:N-acetylglucosamine-6-phosphate deacetylase n=1 Tax=Janibacter sp. CX7 TaxID=2963431 RepID=UPI0020CD529F|nr:N-acetylglucosamine-6-phosphate deacetylase [Janibacter sp. CX7]UTT65498.1 N-acetylglucosamine-6-phosphate deacetylase [Janibacter sp. CX7]
MIVTADRVLTPGRTLAPGWVQVEGEHIAQVGEGGPPSSIAQVEERRPSAAGASRPLHLTGTLVPGFVDTHCHGGGGGSFTVGDADEAATVARAHLAHGTTSLVASLVTDEVDRLDRSVRVLGELVDDGVLAGVHLEGPWLSADFCGAHEPSLLRPPSPEDVDRLLAAGGDALRMVTIAPELDGALDAVRRVVDAGVVVGVGHTDATWEQARAAIDSGATVATHLFNQIRGLHHRHPGPIAALLEDERVWVELISDGVHVHPAMLRLAERSARGRIVLVTDAMGAAAAADGDYHLGPIHVQVRDGVARTASGAIAGSTLTMAGAVRHSVSSGFTLEAAVTAATATPAASLGLTDVGRIEAGARADLVVLDDDLAVTRVMRAGSWVPAST